MINVKKEKLLEILKKNRMEHRDIFLEAQEKYRVQVIQVLDEQLQAARDKRPFMLARVTSLIQPEDHTADYDRVISMLEMDVSPIVQIHQNEFTQYVQDNWGWSRAWAASSVNYSNHPKLRRTMGLPET